MSLDDLLGLSAEPRAEGLRIQHELLGAEAIDIGRELDVLDVQLIAQDVDVRSEQFSIGRGDDGAGER